MPRIRVAIVCTSLLAAGLLAAGGGDSDSGDGSTAVVELTGYPVVSSTGCARITGWFEWFAETAETSARVTHTECRAGGHPTCRWRITW